MSRTDGRPNSIDAVISAIIHHHIVSDAYQQLHAFVAVIAVNNATKLRDCLRLSTLLRGGRSHLMGYAVGGTGSGFGPCAPATSTSAVGVSRGKAALCHAKPWAACVRADTARSHARRDSILVIITIISPISSPSSARLPPYFLPPSSPSLLHSFPSLLVYTPTFSLSPTHTHTRTK